MLENGGFLGLLVGVAVCAIFTVCLILENKKIKEEIDLAMGEIPKENIEKIKNSSFQEYDKNDKFYLGNSIVTDIISNNDKMKIKVLYYNGFWNQYVICSVSMNKETYDKKSIHKGDFVKTLHKKDKDGRLQVKEIL